LQLRVVAKGAKLMWFFFLAFYSYKGDCNRNTDEFAILFTQNFAGLIVWSREEWNFNHYGGLISKFACGGNG